ncbi:MAG TPA: substrate-binding domain-containing protein [Coriobacteriia bacterium]|nr:substrate-binding domain-containing protein [Coriobacteriia bacterium]
MEHLRSIDELEAVRAVSDAHRQQILRLLLARPHTISSLGRHLGRHPAWIRHHVQVLESAGLTRLVEERKTRNYTEKYYAASAAAFSVSLLIRPAEEERESPGEGSRLLALASDDLAMGLLASEGSPGVDLAVGVAGSLDSLIGLRQGLADIAGCHLLDASTGEYNLSYARSLFPDRDLMVVTVSHRDQGLMVAEGNPLGITQLADVAEKNARFANRNRGSGTRVWIDRELARTGVPPTALRGHDSCVGTHLEAARLVASDAADAALGIAAAAERFDLGFVPLFTERYDLVMPAEVYRTEEAARLLEALHSTAFRSAVGKMRGYHPQHTGDEYSLKM